jgi:putative ABC transport system permease protein
MRDLFDVDLRQACRSLRRRPSYALVSVVTLALVVGAATAVIAVVNATMIRPLPYPDAERLVRLYLQPPGTTRVDQRNPLSARTLVRFRAGALQLADAVEGFWVRDRALGGDGDPESVPTASATAGALALLGGPQFGRTWTDAEDRDNARVVVIAHELWQRRFGGDRDVIGRTMLIDREPHEIIGVMPPGFRAIYLESVLWTPFQITEASMRTPTTFIQTVARLRPGVTAEQLDAEVRAAMPRIVAESPETLKGWGGGVVGIREAQFGPQRPALLVLLAAVAALTLLACANLANVTLAHVLSRRAETSLRLSLGASGGRVVRLQIIESLLLGAAGGLAGLLLGAVTLPVLLALDPQTAATLGDVRIDWRVQLATATLAIGVALVAGVVPMLRELGGDAARALAEGSRRSAGSRRDDRVRRVLVAAETALAVILLVCGAVLLSGFQETARLAPGFDAGHVVGAQLRLSPAAYPTVAARNDLVFRVLERIRAIPGVESAGTTMNLFIPGFAYQTLVHIEGRPTPDGQAHAVQFRRVSPDYFRTLRIPVRRGRDFAPGDGPQAPRVVVVSQAFADRYWPGEDPIGRRVRRTAQPDMLTVIGVAGDVRDVGLAQVSEPTLYSPIMQDNPTIAPVSLVVRAAPGVAGVPAAMRAAVLSADPMQPIERVTRLEDFLSDSLGAQRFRSTLLLVLATLGLAIAAVGIYGVTARSVQERTREVGVRLALGAAPSTVRGMMIGQAMRAVAMGGAVGAGLALAAARLLPQVLAGLERANAWTAVPAVAALAIAALGAAALPASRAVKIDPAIALRAE